MSIIKLNIINAGKIIFVFFGDNRNVEFNDEYENKLRYRQRKLNHANTTNNLFGIFSLYYIATYNLH